MKNKILLIACLSIFTSSAIVSHAFASTSVKEIFTTKEEREAREFVLTLFKDAQKNAKDIKNNQADTQVFIDLIHKTFGLETIAHTVLGKHREDFTKEQMDTFMRKKLPFLLVDTFASEQRIELFAGITYHNELFAKTPEYSRRQDRLSFFDKIALPGQQPVDVQFVIIKEKGHYKVFDIKIIGISMLQFIRDKIDNMIQKSTPKKAKQESVDKTISKNTAAIDAFLNSF